MSIWDPAQYRRFGDERSRPFFDLVSRVPDANVRAAADLGCGPGNLTATLATRWPDATVWGVDRSPDMLAAAATLPADPRLRFVAGDIATWEPPRPLDRIVSNAALHWVPDHAAVLPRLAGLLAPGGVLAVQMPNNLAEPAHRLLGELVREPPWAEAVGAWRERYFVQTAAWYAETLHAIGLAHVDVWETIYCHLLPGDDAVLEWMKGTALRPVLSRVPAERHEELLTTYRDRLRPAYPRRSYGTLLPFRRLFFVARKP